MNKLELATDAEIIYFIDKLIKEYDIDKMKFISLTRIKSHLHAHLLICKRRRTTPDNIKRIMKEHYNLKLTKDKYYRLVTEPKPEPTPTLDTKQKATLDTKQKVILDIINDMFIHTENKEDRIRQAEFNNIIKNKCFELFNSKTSSFAINKLMIGDLKYHVVKNNGIRYFCNIKQK